MAPLPSFSVVSLLWCQTSTAPSVSNRFPQPLAIWATQCGSCCVAMPSTWNAYVHSGILNQNGNTFSTISIIPIFGYITICLIPLIHCVGTQSSAHTRIHGRRQSQHLQRPIERFEDANRIRPWTCPEPGCNQHHIAFLASGVWYSNTDGMMFQDATVDGPVHVYIVQPSVHCLSAA